ncbi:right-handed parallel beta-helix repeat-containing protein [bacterium]|nr:right-handed parallel beta-helix repeat-containing protein [bacterium]
MNARDVGFVVVAILSICGVAFAADFYVDADNGSDANTGASPNWPCQTITYMLSITDGSSSDPAVVHVVAGTYSASTNGESFPLTMKSYVSFIGAGAETTILDAEGDAYHVLYCVRIENVNIEGFTIKGGNADSTAGLTSSQGGGIRFGSCGDISIQRCTITGNRAQTGAGIYCESSSPFIGTCEITQNEGVSNPGGNSWGGGLFCYRASPIIRDCAISDNRASLGAGIYCEYLSPIIEGCTIIRNDAPLNSEGRSFGGGIYSHDSSCSISNCTITENTAETGAGVVSETSSGEIVDCTIADNTGTPDQNGYSFAAGIACYNLCHNIINCTIMGNSAYDGAGIRCYNASPTVENCEISENSASCGGGIRCVWQSAPSIINCQIFRNVADPDEDGRSWGGGISSYESSPKISGCTITRNSAWVGAGIAFEDSPSASVEDCTISENTGIPNLAGWSYGGAVWCFDCSPSLKNCLLTENAASCGGGLLCSGSSLDIANCTIAENSATFGDGLFCTDSSSPVVSNTILWGNGDEVYLDDDSSIALSFCCIEGSYSGEGNILDDPLFASGPDGDYYLSCMGAGQGEDSPCIDAGSTTAQSLGLNQMTTRIDGALDSGVVDLGYHYPSDATQDDPTIACYLNASEFAEGDLIAGTVEIENQGPDSTVDIYVAFVMSDGAIVCLTNQGFAVGIYPFMADVFLPEGFRSGPAELFAIPLPGGLQTGDYLFAAALSAPGVFEIIGDYGVFSFTLGNR